MLIIIRGLPGTGKSTLSRKLAERLDAVHISSDNLRLKLVEKRTYSEREKMMVYEKMIENAVEFLRRNKNVILDATFYKRELLEKARKAAEELKKSCILVECILSEEKVKERIAQRDKNKDESEADFQVYKKVKSDFEEITEGHLFIDTSEQLESQVSKVLDYSKNFGGDGEAVDTHISRIYFVNGLVYKIKKPVRFTFLDFSTLEKRRFYCEEEVRLNKRLCPDIYLGVVKAKRHFGGYLFGEEGEEYAVKMKKMPVERQMDNLLARGEVTARDVEKIAEIIADFHQKIAVVRDKRYGNPELINAQVNDILNHIDAIDKATGLGDVVKAALNRCGDFYKKNKSLFAKRQESGFIKECHGDLHSANIVLAEKICIFDCIEFNPDFRNIDVASEIAFMAMDLDAYEREDLSAVFINRYLGITKDKGASILLNYYKCYRANVRAKVAAIEYAQNPNVDSAKKITKYVNLMERYSKLLF